MDMREAIFRRVDAACGGALALLAGGVAHAAPGEHIHLGNSTEITPAVQVAGEYHSNPYLTSGTADSPVDPGAALRVSPSVQVGVDTPDLSLQFAGTLDMRKYFAASLTALDRYSDYNLILNTDVLPEAKVGLHVNEQLKNRSRALEADPSEIDTPTPTDLNLKRLSNQTLFQLAVHPGGALSVNAGGHFYADRYKMPDDIGSERLDRTNNRTGYGPDLDADWRFFPRTAVVFDGSLDFFNWEKNIVVYDKNTSIAKPDGVLLHTLVGLRGRLTDKVLVGVLAGYGQITYSPESVTGDSNSSVVTSDQLSTLVSAASDTLAGFPTGLLVVVEAAWSPVDDHTLTVGFHRDFDDVSFTNYVSYNNMFARYQGIFADRYSVLGEALFRLETYNGSVVRDDHFFRGRLDLAVRTTDFLDLGAGVIFTKRTNADGAHPEVDYSDVTATLGATFSY